MSEAIAWSLSTYCGSGFGASCIEDDGIGKFSESFHVAKYDSVSMNCGLFTWILYSIPDHRLAVDWERQAVGISKRF